MKKKQTIAHSRFLHCIFVSRISKLLIFIKIGLKLSYLLKLTLQSFGVLGAELSAPPTQLSSSLPPFQIISYTVYCKRVPLLRFEVL